MKVQIFLPVVLLFTAVLFHGCSVQGGQGLNFFSIDDDIAMGKEFSNQIESDPAHYPLLKEKGNEEVYRYIRGLTQELLNTGKVAYSDKFEWKVKIIEDDTTLNAFAVPGGYLYVYTGLIKYLDSEDQLQGVMGHEIAHAALRHSTKQMSKIYGLDAIRQMATGNAQAGVLGQYALGLVSLKFSRKHEAQADEYSVIYLCETGKYAAGAAGFFRKIKAASSGSGQSQPQFLSTHPDPGNRIEAIEKKAKELGCQGQEHNKAKYERIKKLLK